MYFSGGLSEGLERHHRGNAFVAFLAIVLLVLAGGWFYFYSGFFAGKLELRDLDRLSPTTTGVVFLNFEKPLAESTSLKEHSDYTAFLEELFKGAPARLDLSKNAVADKEFHQFFRQIGSKVLVVFEESKSGPLSWCVIEPSGSADTLYRSFIKAMDGICEVEKDGDSHLIAYGKVEARVWKHNGFLCLGWTPTAQDAREEITLRVDRFNASQEKTLRDVEQWREFRDSMDLGDVKAPKLMAWALDTTYGRPAGYAILANIVGESGGVFERENWQNSLWSFDLYMDSSAFLSKEDSVLKSYMSGGGLEYDNLKYLGEEQDFYLGVSPRFMTDAARELYGKDFGKEDQGAFKMFGESVFFGGSFSLAENLIAAPQGQIVLKTLNPPTPTFLEESHMIEVNEGEYVSQEVATENSTIWDGEKNLLCLSMGASHIQARKEIHENDGVRNDAVKVVDGYIDEGLDLKNCTLMGVFRVSNQIPGLANFYKEKGLEYQEMEDVELPGGMEICQHIAFFIGGKGRYLVVNVRGTGLAGYLAFNVAQRGDHTQKLFEVLQNF